MGRKSEVEQTQRKKNPAEIFLEWSSKNQCFLYYDKELKEKKQVKLPFTFLFLAERTTIKGFDGVDNTGIYSNEVKYLTEELNVRNFAGNTIAKGVWSDIEDQVKGRDGKFARSIYAMTKKGNLINITLYGSPIGVWFEFTKKKKNRLTDEWITVSDFTEETYKGNKFYKPVFEFNKSLNKDEGKMADKAYEIFEEYESEPSPRENELVDETPNRDNSEVDKYMESKQEEDDDLPF